MWLKSIRRTLGSTPIVDVATKNMTTLDHKLACRQALLLLISEINAEDWDRAEVAAREVQHQAKMVNLSEKNDRDFALQDSPRS